MTPNTTGSIARNSGGRYPELPPMPQSFLDLPGGKEYNDRLLETWSLLLKQLIIVEDALRREMRET
jgi:hypothetical protein